MALHLAPRMRTARLVLRAWEQADRATFAALCADAEVMRYFPSTLTPAESDDLVNRVVAAWQANGFGLWAVEAGPAGFVGFVGLSSPRFHAPFTPCVEIGWRLRRDVWGRGYAPEAARAALAFGFDELGLAEIVSFTTATNAPSRRVMDKIGMHHDSRDDFDHPDLSEGHPLRRHVLYRLGRA